MASRLLSNLLISGFLVFLQLMAFGQSTILTLDNVPDNIVCDEIWTEQGIDLSFVNTTDDDCQVGRCFFGMEPTFIWLYPSRLSIDLTSLSDIQRVEVDIVDFCGDNCTQAFLIDAFGDLQGRAGNISIGISETLTIENPAGSSVSELAISSCEGQVQEIRVYGGIVSSQEICDNGIDDDGDGFIDCLDDECFNLPNDGCMTCFDDGLSFADVVLSYENGCPGSNLYQDSNEALGVSNYNGVPTDGRYLSLGEGGSVRLGFTNNIMTNSGDSETDLWVFEVGPSVEPINLELKPFDIETENILRSMFISDVDGDGYFEFGRIEGSTSGLDIDEIVSGYSVGVLKFDAVKITDLEIDPCIDTSPGADIDAICALTSMSTIVEEICNNGIDDDGDGLIDCQDPDLEDLFCCNMDLCNDAIDRDMDGVGDSCDQDDDNDGITDRMECPPVLLSIDQNDRWEAINGGDSLNVMIGDVFIIRNHYVSPLGIAYDMRFELIGTFSNDNVIDYEVKLNPQICLNRGIPAQQDHISYNIGWVQSGSVTASDLVGVPAEFDRTRVIVSDIDNNNENYTDVGGFLNTAFNFKFGANLQEYILDNGLEVYGLSDLSTIQSDCVGCTIRGNFTPFTSATLIHGITGTATGRVNRLAFWTFELGDCRDSDRDGVPDYLDTDSDNDGCPDAIEGGASITDNDIVNGMIIGNVDTNNGIPILAGAGQTVGASINPNVQDGCMNDEICGNGIDDDGDGLIDCDDPDLFNDCCCFQPSPVNISASAIDFCSGTTVTISVNQAFAQYAWNTGESTSSISVSASGTYTVTVTDRCDGTQTATISVSEIPVMPEFQEYVICAGESVDVNGVTYNMAGTFTQNITTSQGCDNTLTIQIEELPTNVTDESYTICDGDTIELYGQVFTFSGTYIVTQPNPTGCDDVINITIAVVPTEDEFIVVTICEGEEYIFDGLTLTTSGTYTMTEIGAGGCEATTTLTLSVEMATSSDLDVVICEGEVLDINGQTYDVEGSYIQDLTNVAGCDSTLNITLEIEQSVTITENYNITTGGSVTVNGETYTMGGQYVQTVTTGDCDTTLIINVTERMSLVYFDFDACSANVGLDNFSYSEFIPRITDLSCGVVTSSTVYRQNPTVNIHSCTPGLNGSISMCVSSEEGCDYVENSDKASRIDITVTPNAGESILLSGFSFFHKAPAMFEWINGPSMLNNYPRLFGVRVLVNGVEVLRETGQQTSIDWMESTFDFGTDGLSINERSVVSMELIGYCVIGNGQEVTAWDLEDFNLFGGCDNSSNIMISGNIKTEFNQVVESVEVYNTGDHGQKIEDLDNNGKYAFMNNSPSGYYEINAYKNDDHLNGVSTLDLIAIQRHILAIDPIDEPARQVAADINDDNKINGIDLIELRKLILGIYKELPQNTSYKFVEQRSVDIEMNGWQLPESIRYRRLDRHVSNADFMAIKIGDVNGSAIYTEGLNSRSSNISLETRSSNANKVGFYSQDDIIIDGFQIALELDKESSEISVTSETLDLTAANYHYDQKSGNLLISYHNENQQKIFKGESLFTVEGKNPSIRGISSAIESEIYQDAFIKAISIKTESLENTKPSMMVYPNPFSQSATIEFDHTEDETVNLIIINAVGQEIWNKTIDAKVGNNRVDISKDDFSGNGVFTLVLRSNNEGVVTERVVITE